MAAGTAVANHQKVTPIQKVLHMMEKLSKDSYDEKKAEYATFLKYELWAQGRLQEIAYEKKDAEDRIDELQNTIEQADGKVEQFTLDIQNLNDDLGKFEEETQKAKKVREEEHKEFQIMQKDQRDALAALKRAQQMLRDGKAGSALLQELGQASTSNQALSGMTELQRLAASDDLMDSSSDATEGFGKPQKHAETMIKELEDKINNERLASDKKEADKEHKFTIKMNDLQRSIKRATAAKETKSASKGQYVSDAAKARGDLDDQKDLLNAARKSLQDLTQTYQGKKRVIDMNQKFREQEIEAVKKCITIIRDYANKQGSLLAVASKKWAVSSGFSVSSEKTSIKDSDSDSKTSDSENEANPISFLQMLETTARRQQIRQRSSFLASRASAEQTQSTLPLQGVIDTIYKVKTGMQEELNEMTTKGVWCMNEMEATEDKIKLETTEIKKLRTQIQDLNDTITDNEEQKKQLLKESTMLDEAMGDATEQRAEDKAEHKKTVKEAVEGVEAAKQALSIISDFAMGFALVQTSGSSGATSAADQPSQGDLDVKAYNGNSNGVVAMLEVVISDCEQNKDKAENQEKESKATYDQFMEDSKVDKAKKKAHVDRLERNLVETQSDLQGVQSEVIEKKDELHKAKTYSEELKVDCAKYNMSYEERIAKRKAEMENLRKARDLLDPNTE